MDSEDFSAITDAVLLLELGGGADTTGLTLASAESSYTSEALAAGSAGWVTPFVGAGTVVVSPAVGLAVLRLLVGAAFFLDVGILVEGVGSS